jgi:ribosome-binding factor A
MAKKNPFRKDRFEERLLMEINGLIRTGLNDSRLQFVSVTKVELSPDCAYATIFWDTFNSHTRGDAKVALNTATGKIRTSLAQILKVRHVPTLTFVYDNQFEEESKITDLINKTKNSDIDQDGDK